MFRSSSIVLSLLLGSALSLTSLAPTALAQDTMRGMKLAVENCSPCHSIGMAGKSPNRKAPPFRTFGKKWPLEALEEALAEGIEVGHRDGVSMPEFTFEPKDIGHLLAYIRTLRK